jgi:hypothetical protein
MTANDPIRTDEAQAALDTVEKMRGAGLRRAVPPRWYGIGIPVIVAIGFGLYAQEDPGSMPGLVLALGTALFVASSRDKIGVLGKAFPDTRTGIAAGTALIVFLLALFFGGIIIRRTYDLPWVPLVTGLIAGGTLFLLNESERRRYLPTADDSAQR